MATHKPHYLLFCDGCLLPSGALHTEARGRWRFVLEEVISGEKIEATDCETTDHPDRIALLAVMRGLEALEQPSRVTLITTSRYVARGLQYGLVEWRENDYCWEHFGSVQPIRNADLWRRVDVALRFHEVQCRWMAQESPHANDLQTPSADHEVVARTSVSTVATSSLPGGVSTSSEVERSLPVPKSCDALTSSRTFYRPAVVPRESIEMPSTPIFQPSASLVLSHKTRQPRTSRVLWPIRMVWRIILAADAFLVSCLRCLFLLDPLRDQFRPRKS
ncbi:MAG: hypothetical protein MUF23_16015 [Pirellula sp.]|nr:hypothetical protein [Pirellula sp.]